MSEPTQPQNTALHPSESAPEAPQPYGAPPAPDAAALPPTSAGTNGLAVTALVLGIVAFVMAFIPIANMPGAFVALVGLVLGVVAIFQKRSSKGLAISGAAVSFVAGILSIIMIVTYAATIVNAVDDAISKPVTSSKSAADTTDAKAKDAAASAPVAETNNAFGDTVTYKDGLAITVSAPTPYSPSEYAAGADQAANVQFTITVQNGTSKNYDPFLFPTVSSNGTEASSIFDGDTAGLAPTTAVPAGQSVSYVAAFSVADPSKLVLEISPGFEYDDAVFQN